MELVSLLRSNRRVDFLFVICSTTLSADQTIQRRMIGSISGELERTWKVAIVAKFKVQWPQHNCELQLGHRKKGRLKGQGGPRLQRVCLSMYSVTENIFFPFSTQLVAFSYTDFFTTLYFVNQRNYKTQQGRHTP
jgi:hypothetical protein